MEELRCARIEPALFSDSSHGHATNSKFELFNEKGQELAMLLVKNLLSASPKLRSVRFIVSELFVEALSTIFMEF